MTFANTDELRLALWHILHSATSLGNWRGNPYMFPEIRNAIRLLNQGTLAEDNTYDLIRLEDLTK